MADVINRTTKQYLLSVDTPQFPTAQWIINPDLSALSGVPQKYWKISGDTVIEMSQAEKDAVDSAEQTALKIAKEQEIAVAIFGDPQVPNLTFSSTASGLEITTDVNNGLNLNDVTNITADVALTKFVIVSLVHDDSQAVGSKDTIVVREKTSGEYDALGANEFLVKNIKEYSVTANGSNLVNTGAY